MLAVIAQGEDTFRLVGGAGSDVGWVRSKTIGFGGFPSESAAHAAALDGARALTRCLKQEFGITHIEFSKQPRTRTVRDGSTKWVADGRVRLARLLHTENGDGDEFAIEFELPRYANHGVAINVALVVYGAMSRELVGASGSSDPDAA